MSNFVSKYEELSFRLEKSLFNLRQSDNVSTFLPFVFSIVLWNFCRRNALESHFHCFIHSNMIHNRVFLEKLNRYWSFRSFQWMEYPSKCNELCAAVLVKSRKTTNTASSTYGIIKNVYKTMMVSLSFYRTNKICFETDGETKRTNSIFVLFAYKEDICLGIPFHCAHADNCRKVSMYPHKTYSARLI